MSSVSGNSDAIRIFDTTLRDGEQSSGADTLLAAANVNALNRLLVKHEKQMLEALTVAR